MVFHKIPPPAVQTTPTDATQLSVRIKQAETTASAASPQVLRVEQNELNSLLASYITQGQANPESTGANSLRDMRLTLVNDRARIYVVVNLYGKDLALELEGKLHTVNGIAQFEPLSGKVGALPIPRSALKSSMRRMMDSPESREALRLPKNVNDVHIEDGRIVATFK